MIRSRSFKNRGVAVLKIEQSESELLCTDSTALLQTCHTVSRYTRNYHFIHAHKKSAACPTAPFKKLPNYTQIGQ
jgi:hypothetical protein